MSYLILNSSCTYITEVHVSTSWIDHRVCTGQATPVYQLIMLSDTQSSDDYPLSICIYISIQYFVLLFEYISSVNWVRLCTVFSFFVLYTV